MKMLRCGYALAVRFKGIKQDQRIERPEARAADDESGAVAWGGSDWAYIGDTPDTPIFSIFVWYRRLMSFYPNGRRPTDPFFMGRDRVRPYTYSAGMADLRVFRERVGRSGDDGLHGLRVAGYNNSLRGNGEALTVAHGLWKSMAHTRYARFDLRSVCAIAANMVGAENPYGEPPPAREPQRLPEGVQRGEVTPQRADASSSAPFNGPADGDTSEGIFEPDSSDEEGDPSPDRCLRERSVRNQRATPHSNSSMGGVSTPQALASTPHPTPSPTVATAIPNVAMGVAIPVQGASSSSTPRPHVRSSPPVTRTRSSARGAGRGGRGRGRYSSC